MTKPRNYNSKDEELVVICSYVHFSIQRDLADFTAYSPKFNAAYVEAFKTKTAAATELTVPAAETKELKLITARLYATIDSLTDMLARLEGYIKMAKADVPLSVTDFGISPLRRKINKKDAEGILQNLRIVIANIQKYEQALSTQGFTDKQKEDFNSALAQIAADNNQQYQIISNRRALVENNIALFNELYALLSEICEIGKILYKKAQSQKVLEYTFSELKKKVRNSNQTTAQ